MVEETVTEDNENYDEHQEEIVQDENINVPDESKETSEAETRKSDANEFTCKSCPRKFRTKKLLTSHHYEVHSGAKICALCSSTFDNYSCLRKHMRQSHKQQEELSMCYKCGKSFSRKEYLQQHLKICQAETSRKEYKCNYCENQFSSKGAKKTHIKKYHRVEINSGYMLVTEQDTQSKEPREDKEYICKVCPIPLRFSFRKNLKHHMTTKHEGRNDLIKVGKFRRYLGEQEVENQESKTANCDACSDTFSCLQNLNVHKEDVHGEIQLFKCGMCDKAFMSERLKRLHVTRFHRTPSHVCPMCGHKSKEKQHHMSHIETHKQKPSKPKTPISSLKRSHQYQRTKDEAESIRKNLFDIPEKFKKSMITEIVKDTPFYFNKIDMNPLSEEEIIELIKDNNLSDRQVLNICKFLRQKCGRKVITPNILNKLKERKSMFNQFFTEVRLDSNSDLHFKSKKGKPISRSVTYCHDLPGLIAYKKLVENIDEEKEILNVIGIDDGKGILKVVWNWSLMVENDQGKKKLMGPKRSIILAVVSKVKENHFNISVLMNLTKINEVEYALSLDLKLVNIMVGIQTHSSRHPCPYGECWRHDDGTWRKGQDRTIRNIRENRNKWMKRSRNKQGNRINLKDHINCEKDPLMNGDQDEPIIKTVPPPPLHTLLLGPVNHIFKELRKRYKNILKKVSKLHIQRSKYHGKNFEGKIDFIWIRHFNPCPQVTSAVTF